jgi:hypothetical protein
MGLSASLLPDEKTGSKLEPGRLGNAGRIAGEQQEGSMQHSVFSGF